MVRIGCINIDTSHPRAFNEIFCRGDRARYVAVYNDGFRGDGEVEGFMKLCGIERRAQSVEEVAQQVDVGFIQGCNWDKHLSYVEPFFRLGKPVFLDKPMVGCLHDVQKLRAYVEQGAVILGSSCMRYAPAIVDFLALPEEERGKIVSVHSTCGVDEFNYAIHAVEAIGGLLGRGAVSCQYVGGGEVDGIRGETYAVQYASGAVATYGMTYGQWQKSAVHVLTTKKTYALEPAGYENMLERVIASVETGQAQTAPVEDILESILIMLAGRISRARGGARVALAEIPPEDPGFDGDAFEREYAASAKPLYAQ